MTSPTRLFPDRPGARDMPELAEARVAVMITAFRIGPVLTDTILSALDQQHVSPVAVLLVIDGCPETETTGAITQRYLAAHPGRFHVLWLQNGGVSRARNRGLQWLLDCHPDLDAIYCLDGDDLISTASVATGLLALKDAQARHPDRRFGWVVTNKQNFGDDHTYIETPERFRTSSYLSVNLSQPSCLYNAEMFRQGLRWDESMRSGIEDWEFWLTAIRGDFEGVHNPRDLLYYRRLMGNRSSVNRRNDAYNIPYMRDKHAPLFRPQAVLADEQANTPRFAFGSPDADAFDMTSDPAEPGQRLSLVQARNALGARLQRQAPQDYIYDPYAPELFVVMDDTLRTALQRMGLLRGVLVSAADLLSDGAAIAEGLVLPLADEQRDVAASGDLFLFHVKDAPRPRNWETARRSFFVIRPGQLFGIDADRLSPARIAKKTRRLLLRTDALSPSAERGFTNAQLLRLIRQLAASDAGSGESDLGKGQGRFGRYYLSSRQISQHAALTQKAIGTGPLFPQLSTTGHRRVAVILPSAGLTASAEWLLGTLSEHLGDAGRISVFSTSNHLPNVAPKPRTVVENVSSLAPWLNYVNRAPRGHSVGVPRWENMDGSALNRLAGLLAPFDEVVSFDLQMFAPVMLKLRSLGVNTVSCEPDQTANTVPLHAAAKVRAMQQLPDDPVAAQPYAAAYTRIICRTQARADLLSALGYPQSRIEIGAENYLETLLPGLAAAAE